MSFVPISPPPPPSSYRSGSCFLSISNSLWNTHNNSNGIETYALYWCMSVTDYHLATGDNATLSLYVLNIDAKLQHALAIEGSAAGWVPGRGGWQPAHLTFVGWDERLGAGFENASCAESQRLYSMLTARACLEFARALQAARLRPDLVTRYQQAAGQIFRQVRALGPDWHASFGLHAASDAINTGLTTETENDDLATRLFGDLATICSHSSFNMYWILQALGRLGDIYSAGEAIERCWLADRPKTA